MPHRFALSSRLLALGLLALTVFAYLPALTGGFIWDDDLYILNNQLLRSFDGLKAVWFHIGATPQYYPLTYTSFWLEFHLWEFWPTGYHLTNILLHATNAVLLWRILLFLMVPGSWFIAAVFALHPVHVESVAWITERKNVLSGFFYFSSLLYYLRFALPAVKVSTEHHEPRWLFYLLALLFFQCALFSKTVTSTLPATLLLLLWWKKPRLEVKDVALLLPLFVMSIPLVLTTAHLEKAVVGAVGEFWHSSIIERILIASRALWFYAGKLVWPTPLTFIYPRWEIDTGIWWQYAFPLGLVILAIVVALQRRKLGKGPISALCIFGGTLAPALGFFNVFPMRYSYVADHFQYLASIGLITLFGALLWKREGTPDNFTTEASLLEVPSEESMFQIAPYRTLVSFSVLLALGALTWQQGHIYKDLKTLWTDTLEKNPSAWMAHNNMGILSTTENNYEKAIAHFTQALAINSNAAEVHGNLCLAYYKVHKNEAAILHGLRAIALQPEWFAPYSHLAMVFGERGDFPQAAEYLRKAIERSPNNAQLHYNLGVLYLREASAFPHISPREAITHLERALALHPGSPETLYVLARVLATHPDLAIRNGERALRFAKEACQRTHYRVPAFLAVLAAAYAESGQFPRAIEVARQALTLAEAQQQIELVRTLQERILAYQSRIS